MRFCFSLCLRYAMSDADTVRGTTRGVELLHFFDPSLIFGQETFLKYDEMCIHTSEDASYSKAKFISNFVLPPLPTSPHTLLFVDDRLENIQDVSNYVPGTHP